MKQSMIWEGLLFVQFERTYQQSGPFARDPHLLPYPDDRTTWHTEKGAVVFIHIPSSRTMSACPAHAIGELRLAS
jgi:hypothetical protein